METKSDAVLLLQYMDSEIESISLFTELLRKEQSVLSQGQTDDLPALVEQKNLLADRLGSLAAQRNNLLVERGFTIDRQGIEAWCVQHPQQTKVSSAWTKILSLAAEAKELNRLNGELIALRMRHNALALEALRSGTQSLSLYGPDGQSTTQENLRINDSV